jgi:hypothetical protein
MTPNSMGGAARSITVHRDTGSFLINCLPYHFCVRGSFAGAEAGGAPCRINDEPASVFQSTDLFLSSDGNPFADSLLSAMC